MWLWLIPYLMIGAAYFKHEMTIDGHSFKTYEKFIVFFIYCFFWPAPFTINIIFYCYEFFEQHEMRKQTKEELLEQFLLSLSETERDFINSFHDQDQHGYCAILEQNTVLPTSFPIMIIWQTKNSNKIVVGYHEINGIAISTVFMPVGIRNPFTKQYQHFETMILGKNISRFIRYDTKTQAAKEHQILKTIATKGHQYLQVYLIVGNISDFQQLQQAKKTAAESLKITQERVRQIRGELVKEKLLQSTRT